MRSDIQADIVVAGDFNVQFLRESTVVGKRVQQARWIPMMVSGGGQTSSVADGGGITRGEADIFNVCQKIVIL